MKNMKNTIDLGWDNFMEDLPKFEYVEGDSDLDKDLVEELEKFIESDNHSKREATKYIGIIENGGLLDNKQKHLLYYHIKYIESNIGEFKNEVVKEYLKDFVPEKQPWEK